LVRAALFPPWLVAISAAPEPRDNPAMHVPLRKDRIMDDDRIEGAGKQVKGSIKEAIGKITGDRSAQAEGAIEKAKGKAQSALGKAKDAARDKLGK
jgi:uncharacterized protein YjbJ (UPF0337 family)